MSLDDQSSTLYFINIVTSESGTYSLSASTRARAQSVLTCAAVGAQLHDSKTDEQTMRCPYPSCSACCLIAWTLLLAVTCRTAGEGPIGPRPGNPLARVRRSSRHLGRDVMEGQRQRHQVEDGTNLTLLPSTAPSIGAPTPVDTAMPAKAPTPHLHAYPVHYEALNASKKAFTGFARFDRVFVINLEQRTDRLASISKTAASVGITNFTVVRGVPHPCGALGCALAHILALRNCLAAGDEGGVDACLILEDDFVVRGDVAGANAQVERFFGDAWPGDLKRWDVLMLSSNLQLSIRMHLDYLVRVVRGLSTSGYAVRRQYVSTLVDEFVGAASLLNKDCGQRSVLANSIDSAWLPLQARDAWFAFKTSIGYQAASFSDVKHTHADYGGI